MSIFVQAKLADINPEVREGEYKKTSEKYEHAKKAAAGKRSELERLERELGDLNVDLNRKVGFPLVCFCHRPAVSVGIYGVGTDNGVPTDAGEVIAHGSSGTTSVGLYLQRKSNL